MLKQLYQTRRRDQWLQYFRYWRYVFNDHFVIAMFFLFGAAAFGYQGILPQVTPQQWWWNVLVVVWLTIAVQWGRLALFIKDPDPVFLLPQTSQTTTLMREVKRYSYPLGLLLAWSWSVVALPLYVRLHPVSWSTIGILVVTISLVKLTWFKLAQFRLVNQSNRGWQVLQWLWPGVIAILIVMNPFFAVLGASLGWLVSWRWQPEFNWRAAIEYENERLLSIYRFFNLFTDVPNLPIKVKRRRWLNWLINWLSDGTVWGDLYARALVRQRDYGDLIVRLSLVVGIAVAVIPIPWVQTLLMVVGVYVIAGQFGPLFHHFDHNPMPQLYPTTTTAATSWLQLVRKVLVIEWLGLSLIAWRSPWHWINLVLGLIIVVGLITWSLSKRYLKEK
ncbi:ABC transporter permease [Limosilactobacillus equigenerosi]|uniref:ABC transporter permease component n=1 Tax=Limosilactobacillus equigenerosi DSM 18793 = JCM 14505 TaxID=1423742 RepID=A0A0R1UL78_9LACO|nr:ABC transporter permease [Limosilactobacillus equigenerosi]KRL93998.1 ABC transporter permease component [Limosilactobacillus equigenerosi DSM 18793 = JCM 14505]